MIIQTISHREDETLNLDGFVELAIFALEREEVPDECVVSIAVVENDEMADLNFQYREKEGPTDVLSFPCDSTDDMFDEDEPITLGDIIIAPAIAVVQAEELGHSVEHELNVLLIHGILHLLGYDHIDDADAEIMQARERSILEAWSFHKGL